MIDPIKVLFLDVDGVLHDAFVRLPSQELNPECMRRLRTIIDKTHASIVISSSWRIHTDNLYKLRDKLNEYGLDYIDTTPDFTGKNGIPEPRKFEIEDWLQKHPNVEKWVILDDDIFGNLDGIDNFVKTDSVNALTDADVDSVIEILGGKPINKGYNLFH